MEFPLKALKENSPESLRDSERTSCSQPKTLLENFLEALEEAPAPHPNLDHTVLCTDWSLKGKANRQHLTLIMSVWIHIYS